MSSDVLDKDNGERTADSNNIDMEFLQDFIVEAKEHIENIEMNSLILETEPENMEIVNSLFRSFHTVKGLAGFVEQELIRKIAHQTETLLDECRKGSLKVSRVIVDLILNSSDYIKRICNDINLNHDPEFLNLVELQVKSLDNRGRDLPEKYEQDTENCKTPKIGEIISEQANINKEEIEELVLKQKEYYPELKLGQVVLKEKKAEAKDIIQSIRTQQNSRTRSTTSITESSYVRVPNFKVDNLVDMMGELIIIQSLIEQEAGRRFGNNDSFINNILRMTRITKDVQNLSMSLRMVSLKSTFQKITRIARDTINELKKNVSIQVTGEETEIDRSIAEKILDPLLHLVKNSISHGGETEEERSEKGKPVQRLVTVEAFSKRGIVYIQVSDDGKGINIEKVYRKAIEKKLADPSVNYSEDEIMNFIFLPGFSTAESVNNVSGRGVGLDVVKTEVARIGGKIEVTNNPGYGCTFILKIPINMAVMNGTIVDILGTNYIIPTIHVKQIFKPLDDQWVSLKGKKSMIRVRDDIIHVIPIEKIFGYEEEKDKKDTSLIIVMELEQKLKALPVRRIVGKQEIVVKSLGSEFRHLNFVSGASILGDGKVSLILDIETLFKDFEGSG